MKYRQGFVSNSSSSSFIIGEVTDPLLFKALQAVEEVRIIPIKEVAKEFLLASGRGIFLKHFDNIPEDVKYIAFQSCNYETEILNIDGNVLITTCNNERMSWDNALNTLEHRFDTSSINIEYNDELTEKYVYESKFYGYSEYEMDELECSYVSLNFNPIEIAKQLGPAAFVAEKGVILYENETRICIK